MTTKNKIEGKKTGKDSTQAVTSTSNESINQTATEAGSSVETHIVLIDGKAAKLSTKKRGFVTFILAKCIGTDELELKITGNDSGGLYSKRYVNLISILKILDVQVPDKPFKSSVFKSAFHGSSSNNPSFLAAILRSKDINLIVSTEKSQYLHMIPNNYESVREQLLAKALAK
tara:strand:- start:2683 stop:3201 length:519 start_codon:yes stop_codon:yes gene_type:complete